MPNRSPIARRSLSPIVLALILAAVLAGLGPRSEGAGLKSASAPDPVEPGDRVGPPEHCPPRPSAEALSACAAKDWATPCAYRARNGGEIRGQCASPHPSLPLACAPPAVEEATSRQR